MKLILLFFLTFLISYTPEDRKCDSMEKCIESLFREKKANDFLHTEIKERIPFRFLNTTNCNSKKFEYYQIISVKKFENDSIRIRNGFDVHVLKFREFKNKVEMNIFYPIEGGGMDCIFEKVDDKYSLKTISFYEH